MVRMIFVLTRVAKVNPIQPERTLIAEAAEVIVKGGLVAFPTETVYGLGANAFNVDAVKKIFAVKNRPPDNPLIVHISDLEMIHRVALDVPEKLGN
jgi:L-threonylcarbamoyladenylate synthase